MSEKRPQDVPSVDDYEFYLAEDLEKRKARQPRPAAPPQDVPTRPGSLAERAARAPKKKMSALELVEAAEREAREAKEREKKAELARKLAMEAAQRVAREKAEQKKRDDEEEERRALEEAEWARKAFGSSAPPKEVAGKKAMPKPTGPVSRKRGKLLDPAPLPEGAAILQTYRNLPQRSLVALMKSHQSRAVNQGDLALAISLAEVCNALENDIENVRAQRIAFGEDEWAVWSHQGRLLGAFLPADLYLVGL